MLTVGRTRHGGPLEQVNYPLLFAGQLLRFDLEPRELLVAAGEHRPSFTRWVPLMDPTDGHAWVLDWLKSALVPIEDAHWYEPEDNRWDRGPGEVPIKFAHWQPDDRVRNQLPELMAVVERTALRRRRRRLGRSVELTIFADTLRSDEPVIRTVWVAPTMSLADLAVLINSVFGYGSDLGAFALNGGDLMYQIPEADEYDALSSHDLQLGTFLTKETRWWYYYGHIEHSIRVEGYLKGIRYPTCGLASGEGTADDIYVPDFDLQLYQKHLERTLDAGLDNALEAFYLTAPRASAEIDAWTRRRAIHYRVNPAYIHPLAAQSKDGVHCEECRLWGHLVAHPIDGRVTCSECPHPKKTRRPSYLASEVIMAAVDQLEPALDPQLGDQLINSIEKGIDLTGAIVESQGPLEVEGWLARTVGPALRGIAACTACRDEEACLDCAAAAQYLRLSAEGSADVRDALLILATSFRDRPAKRKH